MVLPGKFKVGRIDLLRYTLLALVLFASDPLFPETITSQGYRIGLTPVFLEDHSSFLKKWRAYLEKHLGKPVRFIQRRSYQQITELLLKDQLDVAWICGFPYVRHHNNVRLLAVPLYEGKPLYQSYLIVPAEDDKTRQITDLGGSVFAYSDPDSNSGYLVPQVQLKTAKIEASRFFKKTFFTWNHSDVVIAVADGVAQGGAVDGYVWETLASIQPRLTERTKVVWKSDKFGFPPFVSRKSLSYEDFQRFRRVLKGMDKDPEGKQLLLRLNLDGFISGEDRLFEGIRKAMLYIEQG